MQDLQSFIVDLITSFKPPFPPNERVRNYGFFWLNFSGFDEADGKCKTCKALSSISLLPLKPRFPLAPCDLKRVCGCSLTPTHQVEPTNLFGRREEFLRNERVKLLLFWLNFSGFDEAGGKVQDLQDLFLVFTNHFITHAFQRKSSPPVSDHSAFG